MIELWFYIEGNRDVSLISISPDLTIHDMKKQIYAEEYIQSIVECGPANLALTKVRYIVNIRVTMNCLCWLVTSAGQ
jgi:hypothetical protein